MKKILKHPLSIAVMVISLFSFYNFLLGDNDNNSNDYSNNDLLAYNYAEDFVKKQLKSPSTAEFPSVSEKSNHITNLGGGRYKIKSWVDSQNGFGAIIRSEFSCTIVFNGNNVKAENLKIY